MTDAVLDWADDAGPDVAILGNDVATDGGLQAAVLVALFSDARASADDGLPAGADPRGHWGDAFTDQRVGSLLWLISREKILPDLTNRIEEYARTALQRLVDAGRCKAFTVAATRSNRNTIVLAVAVVAMNEADVQPGSTGVDIEIDGISVQALLTVLSDAAALALPQYES